MLTDQLETRIGNLENIFKGIQMTVSQLQNSVLGKAGMTDLSRTKAELQELIAANAMLIDKLNAKLAMVILPEDTKYYLSQADVSDFQSNFNKMKAMMIQMEKLYKNIIAYQSTLGS